jgi:hypothetical protein
MLRQATFHQPSPTPRVSLTALALPEFSKMQVLACAEKDSDELQLVSKVSARILLPHDNVAIFDNNNSAGLHYFMYKTLFSI